MNAHDITFGAIMNCIQSLVTGKRCDYDDPQFKQYLSRLEFACEHFAESAIVLALPFMR